MWEQGVHLEVIPGTRSAEMGRMSQGGGKSQQRHVNELITPDGKLRLNSPGPSKEPSRNHIRSAPAKDRGYST